MQKNSEVDQTPLMKQYWELKSQASDCLLLFRMGDFYELFGPDAVEASQILEITLTSRDKSKTDPIPMAGVPHHSAHGYIQRLLKAGKKVAIAEQMEDPAHVKGIVPRQIIRVFTPAIKYDVESSETTFLAVLLAKKSEWFLCCLDPSTGEIRSGKLDQILEIHEQPITHLLYLSESIDAEIIESLKEKQNLYLEEIPKNYLTHDRAVFILNTHYENLATESVISNPIEQLGLGILIQYVLKTQKQEKILHLQFPKPIHCPRSLVYGPRTPIHLDLFPTQDETNNLYQLINKTKTSMGSRLLKRWISEPLTQIHEIKERQEAVQFLNHEKLQDAAKILSEIYDLERILGRVSTGLASPTDTYALGKSLKASQSFYQSIVESPKNLPPLLELTLIKFKQACENLNTLTEQILNSQLEPPPLTSKEGGIFKKGTSAELDRLIDLTENGQNWLVEFEAQERKKTGISSLKVKYNKVFGYFIEVTHAHIKNVPPHYQRKQTMVGAERFFTEELKKFEEEILTSSIRQKNLEQNLFLELIKNIQTHTQLIMQIAQVISEIDCLICLGKLSKEPGWNFPIIDESQGLIIKQGRHPLLDQRNKNGFVPNDLFLSSETRRALLITGPNMGGKSTFMRQTALIVILGQIGAPVPAAQATWGYFSSIYTRIGAHDAISKGQSTFMVEMNELAHILRFADERSLIVLDEIGRGTSTYDGMSVAWASLEWIVKKINARTLFATHYHELTRLAEQLPLLANAHMAVEGEKSLKKGKLRFLYELRDGPSNESFGIQVAQLAGLPTELIQKAWEILNEWEQQPTVQLPLFHLPIPNFKNLPEEKIIIDHLIDHLLSYDINQLTPLQALNALSELQKRTRELDSIPSSKQNQQGF